MLLFLAVSISFLVTFTLLPLIIKVSKSIDVLDMPDRRKIHKVSTPSLGGIGIFIGFVMAMLISISFAELAELKFFLGGVALIFVLGIRDDIASLQAKHKIAVQLLCAVLIVFFSGIKLHGLYGILGVHELPYGVAEFLSVFMIVGFTNSFNLIDGIDGLAGSLGFIILSLFGWLFLKMEMYSLAIFCLAVSGSLGAFLFFNWHPSKVFMGDTGSMLLGFITSVLAIVVINNAQALVFTEGIIIKSPVALTIGALSIPIYDTLRVFIIRFSKGQSPLAPDRNHIHHGLLKLGMKHSSATLILVSLNLLILSAVVLLNETFTNGELILLTAGIMFSFGLVIDLLGRRRKFLGISSQVKSPKTLYVSKSA
ncbi:MAG: MraY family glycosyltransferase [Cyclobacteriaceae bacterium]